MVTIVRIRGGVEFTPDAADAFRRAEARVQAKRGRNIDVNSTYRSRSKQLAMYNAWQAWQGGWGPYPGHSKALHPDDPLAFHVTGEALDSDDWRDAWIVQVLAENGFIRNRLYVPNEEHHFEYIRSKDRNYGKEIDMPLNAADKKWIKKEIARGSRLVWTGKSTTNGNRWGDMLRVVYNSVRVGKRGVRHHGDLTGAIMSEIGAQKNFRARHGGDATVDVKALAKELAPLLNEQEADELVQSLIAAQGKALTDAAD